ncbi:MAG: prolyl oligopeptidase family serine peptidase, partial [Lachnospiraceae bacterium]|nr:prolyl oligopeptidase family serine peptidase [Lachnospiraceae bacterium]
YYTRWMMLFPEPVIPGHRYPLVIANHGGSNSIETDEFSMGFPQIAGKEGFAVLLPQNTNADKMEHYLEEAMKQYPIDPERIYMAGYSQGGYQVTSTIFRMPERFAAIAPCGNDIFREWDNFNVPYTTEEYESLKKAMVPVIQVNGACEASNFVPVNDWAPRKNWGRNVRGILYDDPRRNDDVDPTRIKGGARPFSNQPVPPEGEDRHEWMIGRLNRRMDSLNCELRDAKKCIGYLNTPEDELHHVLGFYGDREKIEEWYGYKHYTLEIDNKEGMPAFKFVAVENSAHWPSVMMGRYAWDFFKQYRRDTVSGNVVVDPYQYK